VPDACTLKVTASPRSYASSTFSWSTRPRRAFSRGLVAMTSGELAQRLGVCSPNARVCVWGSGASNHKWCGGFCENIACTLHNGDEEEGQGWGARKAGAHARAGLDGGGRGKDVAE